MTAPRMRLVTDVTAAEFEQLAHKDAVHDRLQRLLAIEAAAIALVDKVFGPNGHAAKHYSHIKIGAIAPLRDAIHSKEQQ